MSKGASGGTSEESGIPSQAKNPRWCHATDGTAAQDKAHFMDCSRGTGPRHEELFESGDGHYTNGFHFVSLARNTDRNTQHGRGKASGATICTKLQTLGAHPTATAKDGTMSASASVVRQAKGRA